jgi:hypothetical protein
MDTRAIIDAHLPGLDEQWRPTVERLLEVILGEIPDAQHERKWGRLTFTRERDWHHWICAIAPSKKAVKLVIHKGALLADPQKAMQGSARYTRAIPFRAPDEIDPSIVGPILDQAAARQTEMLPDSPN